MPDSFTPPNGFSGRTTFTYAAADNQNAQSSATVTIHVGIDGPGGELRGQVFEDMDGDGVFGAGDTPIGALGHFVHVYVDRETLIPAALPAAVRASLTPLVV